MIDDIGDAGWSYDEMRAAYGEFKAIYRSRPVQDNAGGMKAPHAFLTWFMLSRLAPSLVVESGVWKGQGTWLIEQACPAADLVCIDLNLSMLEYRSKRADYFDIDFDLIDFSGRDRSSAVCFFDDHQDAYRRLQQMHWKGFRRAIFEDNYPGPRGDCYSIKKMMGGHGFMPEPPTAPARLSLRRLLRGAAPAPQAKQVPPNRAHRAEFVARAEVYYEGPPLYRTATTRWGDKWADDLYPTKEPLFADGQGDELFAEAKDYTWMCFVQLT